MELWLLYKLIIIAIAMAASAAAMVITKMAKNTPSNLPGYRYLLNATKLIFTLFRIISMAISIVIILRRVNRPYMPIKNRAVLTKRICDIDISLMLKCSLCGMRSKILSSLSLFCWFYFHGYYNTSNHGSEQ